MENSKNKPGRNRYENIIFKAKNPGGDEFKKVNFFGGQVSLKASVVDDIELVMEHIDRQMLMEQKEFKAMLKLFKELAKILRTQEQDAIKEKAEIVAGE